MLIFPSQNAAFVRPEKGDAPQTTSRARTSVRRFQRALTRHNVETCARSRTTPHGAAASSMGKRAFDLIASSCALIALAPLLILLAILVKTTSRGPILFKQVRTGLGGHAFVILKFRTMIVHERNPGIIQACRNDHRLTPIGRFLRSSSLDELPQFLNVLLGDMSIVGPRPHAIAHDRHYGAMISTYHDRFRVRPGITGFAQCNGARGPTETLDKMRRRIRLDLAYVERWSWMMELKIISKTVKVLMSGDETAF